jgi:LysM repeat protein
VGTLLLVAVVCLVAFGCTPLPSTRSGREPTTSRGSGSSGSTSGTSRTSQTPRATSRTNTSGGVTHTVRRGETLWRISQTYGIELHEIVSANGLDSYTIYPGQELIIPGASSVREVPSAIDNGPPPEPGDVAIIWPLAGRGRGSVMSGFGTRTHPIRRTEEFHKGIDIDGAREERVLAAAAGEVVFSGRMNGYGTVVMIDHGERLITLYAHLSRAAVDLEDRVAQGQAIGYVGSTGDATGTHLHFEIRHKGRAVDPLDYLP